MATQSGCHLWRSHSPEVLTTGGFPAVATKAAGTLERFRPMFPMQVSSYTVLLGPTHPVRFCEKGRDNLPHLIVGGSPCLARLRTDTRKMSQRFRHPCITVRTIWRVRQPHSFKVCMRRVGASHAKLDILLVDIGELLVTQLFLPCDAADPSQR